MTFKTIVSQSFDDDLDSVLEYISEKLHNPSASKRPLFNVEKVVANLSDAP